MTDEQKNRVLHFVQPRTKDLYFIAMASEARRLTVSCSCLGMVKLIGERNCAEQRYAHHRLQLIQERVRKVLDVLIKVKRELMHIMLQKFNATFMVSIDEMYSQEEVFTIKILYKKQARSAIYFGPDIRRDSEDIFDRFDWILAKHVGDLILDNRNMWHRWINSRRYQTLSSRNVSQVAMRRFNTTTTPQPNRDEFTDMNSSTNIDNADDEQNMILRHQMSDKLHNIKKRFLELCGIFRNRLLYFEQYMEWFESNYTDVIRYRPDCIDKFDTFIENFSRICDEYMFVMYGGIVRRKFVVEDRSDMVDFIHFRDLDEFEKKNIKTFVVSCSASGIAYITGELFKVIFFLCYIISCDIMLFSINRMVTTLIMVEQKI